jgi:t-SNARE complex subunit (syntaxin)
MKKMIGIFWDWVFSKTTIDEKVIAVAKETKKRVKAVKTEIKDVAKAVKEVGNQVGDVGDAIKGKARKGRKKKDVK